MWNVSPHYMIWGIKERELWGILKWRLDAGGTWVGFNGGRDQGKGGKVGTGKGLLTRTMCVFRGSLSEPYQEWIRSFCALLGQRPSSLFILGYRSISVASLMVQ
jgi:hypothetical protein